MDLQGHVVGDEHPSICCENQSRKGVDTCVPFRKKNMIFTVKKNLEISHRLDVRIGQRPIYADDFMKETLLD